jgi:hypothetical protein
MGGAIKKLAISAGKAILKGATSFVLGKVPVIGTPVADWINNKYANGGAVGMEVPIPPGFKAKPLNSAKDVINLINAFPDEAKKAGLTVEMVEQATSNFKNDEASNFKKKGGAVMMKKGGAMGEPKLNKEGGAIKKPRSAAQKAATAKLVAMNKAKRGMKC